MKNNDNGRVVSSTTSMKSNSYMDLIYEKPTCNKYDNIFKKIITKFKERFYFSNKIKPLLYEFRHQDTEFLTLCLFSDLIRMAEQNLFYKNDTQYEDPKKNIRLLSDNKMEDEREKILIMIYKEDQVVVTFKMRREMEMTTKDTFYYDMIHITVLNNFGRKLKTEFDIVNKDCNLEPNEYNLLYKINRDLKEALADTFLEIYNMEE